MKNEVFIWGAGHYGALAALDCERKGIKVRAFIDANAYKIKTKFGLSVLGPEYLTSLYTIPHRDSNFIIIAVQNERSRNEITQTLLSVGLKIENDFGIFTQNIMNHEPPFKVYKYQTFTSFVQHMNFFLTDHCNLNCAYCNVNCPVAEPKFPNIEQLELDFIKLSKLTNGIIGRIILTGGEALLNPNMVQIMQIARKTIPNNDIVINTNGILLTKMNSDFWIACKNNYISIVISSYPINLDVNKISQIAKKYEVNIFSANSVYNEGGKLFYSHKYDMSGKQDINEAHEKCHTKTCTTLIDGKIYRCSQIPYSKLLEKAFNVHFSISSQDFLVLDKINNVQEILDFISHPSPFCRYCATKENHQMQWKISERKREEWIL